MVGSRAPVDDAAGGAADVPFSAPGDAVFGVCAQAAATPSDEIRTDADANKRARNAMNAPVHTGEL
jgi:hypothetical protein